MSNNDITNWIPEICYEEVDDGMTSQIPFIEVPIDKQMPRVLISSTPFRRTHRQRLWHYVPRAL